MIRNSSEYSQKKVDTSLKFFFKRDRIVLQSIIAIIKKFLKFTKEIYYIDIYHIICHLSIT